MTTVGAWRTHRAPAGPPSLVVAAVCVRLTRVGGGDLGVAVSLLQGVYIGDGIDHAPVVEHGSITQAHTDVRC